MIVKIEWTNMNPDIMLYRNKTGIKVEYIGLDLLLPKKMLEPLHCVKILS